ncbi:DUF368 domain-containing protein [Roseiconus lacunae]|uniref:DUF368 domain-containing protein n=1 Tax=Roseiconus lacunae TaxID=2605694 RepID=UPI0030891B6E|nr:DUF368 domain-containing protein [Stieleria sp. HD01]
MTASDHQDTSADKVDPNGVDPGEVNPSPLDPHPSVTSPLDLASEPDSSVPPRPPMHPTVVGDAINVARGFCMGAADTVPGVSGGTIALILGHYERLVTAISRVDRDAIGLVTSGRFRQAFDHVDGRFLAAIGMGVGTGIVTLAGVMHWLLDHHMPETFAVFFGLIIASVLIVGKTITRWSVSSVVALAFGVGVAIMIGRLSPTDGGDSLVYLFGSAAIAICAMILPGISGAFILLLLGVYHPITGMVKDFAKGNVDTQAFLSLTVFACGCLFGLLAFSRLLHWMLDHHKNLSMAGLIGLMLGSVEKLWPLQIPTPETASLKMKERVMQTIHPSDWEGNLWSLLALAIVSAVAILVLERIAGAATEAAENGIAG